MNSIAILIALAIGVFVGLVGGVTLVYWVLVIPLQRSLAQVDRGRDLARAVLMFHGGGEWSDRDRKAWKHLTWSDEATSKTLCDQARVVLDWRQC